MQQFAKILKPSLFPLFLFLTKILCFKKMKRILRKFQCAAMTEQNFKICKKNFQPKETSQETFIIYRAQFKSDFPPRFGCVQIISWACNLCNNKPMPNDRLTRLYFLPLEHTTNLVIKLFTVFTLSFLEFDQGRMVIW